MSAPTPPDTSQAVAAADAAATQLGASNFDVSVRIGSPGDNGTVTQTIAAQTPAQSDTAQSDTTTQAASAAAGATQAAPANVAVSVRIASPGTDGPVTQTIAADASAQTQYQPPSVQYQAPPSAAPTPEPAAPTATVAQPSVTTTGTQSLPTVWNWNWTWTCGDTTDPGITQTIDTGIQGWIWTWNIGTMCATSPAPVSSIAPITPPQSDNVISPAVQPPVPPVLPQPPQPPQPLPPQPPQPPQPLPPQPPQLPEPVPAPPLSLPSAAPSAAELLPAPDGAAPPLDEPEVDGPAATSELGPLLQGVPLPSAAPRFESPRAAAGHLRPLPYAAETSTPAASPQAPPARKHERSAPPPEAKDTPPLEVLAFPPPPIGGSGMGGTGGGGSGVVAALALWILLQLPGLAVLRLPPSRRNPRARVDDIRNRPG